MKNLIYNVLQSLPTKRQALSLIKKLHSPQLGLVKVGTPCSTLASHLLTYKKLGLSPIVVCDVGGTFQDRFLAAHQWSNLIQGRVVTAQGMDPTLVERGLIPVLPSVLEVNDCYVPATSRSILTRLCSGWQGQLDKLLVFHPEAEASHGLINLSQGLDLGLFPVALHEDIGTIQSCLTLLGQSASAVLCSPNHSHDLYANLIAEKPFMTTVFRLGTPLVTHTSLDTVDLVKLQTLLEKSFGKCLLDDYWDRLRVVCEKIVIAGDYQGATIVTMEANEQGECILPYLDKFAVDPACQGTGCADILWARLRNDFPNLSWRSRLANPVNKWYFERSDGNCRLQGDYWMLFWYGYSLDSVDAYKAMSLSIPASFCSE